MRGAAYTTKPAMMHPMQPLHLPRGLYAIVDGSARVPPLELVAAFVAGGAAVVQLRLKHAGTGDLVRVARRAKGLCAGRALFLVNDRPDVALLCGADGVHLGQDDLPVAEARAIVGPGRLVGVSTHSAAELDGARGADYAGFGPVFATTTKEAALPPPHGIAGLREAVRRAGALPVVAIGGITVQTAREVAGTGARCAAVIGALSQAADPMSAARAFSEALR